MTTNSRKGKTLAALEKARVGKSNGQFSHGRAGSTEYRIWGAIKRRCLNCKDTKWHLYGGRGIKVCDEWQRSFMAFYNHVGPRPSKSHSIDRKDVNGHYEPGNVRWATSTEQSRNARTNQFITFNGKTMIQADWAAQLCLTATALTYRLKRWPFDAALTLSAQERVPLRKRMKNTGP